MSQEHFPNGVITATVTPFDNSMQVDHARLADHCRNLIGQGGAGIALLGTTGEANSLSVGERKSVLEYLLASGFDARRIMLGAGCCALPDTADLIRHGLTNGVRDFLIMPPFFYRQVNSQGLLDYFGAVLDSVGSSDVRIYYYHFPRMSGIDPGLAFLQKLFGGFPDNVVGMKDSSADLTGMIEYLVEIPGIRLYSGTEMFLTEVVSRGGCGCISATTNYRVGPAADVYESIRQGQLRTENKEKMIRIRKAFEGYNLSAATKGMIARERNDQSWNRVRVPLTPLSDSALDDIAGKIATVQK